MYRNSSSRRWAARLVENGAVGRMESSCKSFSSGPQKWEEPGKEGKGWDHPRTQLLKHKELGGQSSRTKGRGGKEFRGGALVRLNVSDGMGVEIEARGGFLGLDRAESAKETRKTREGKAHVMLT